jgi:hypothetical protein
LTLNTVLVVVGLIQAVAAQQRTGFPYASGYLVTMMVDLARVLIVPFLFLTGVEWVNFGLDVTRWGAKSVQRYSVRWITALVLILFLGYRLTGLIAQIQAEGVEQQRWGAWIGAAILAGGLLGLNVWLQRKPAGAGVPYGLIVALIVLLPLFQILLAPLLTFVAFFFFASASAAEMLGGADLTGMLADANRILGYIGEWSNAYREYWYLIIAFVGILIAWFSSRRKHITLTAFGLILAWSQGLEWLSESNHPLAILRCAYTDVDRVLVLALAGLAGVWILRRQLTDLRARRLLTLALLGAVLTQTSFLDNPFSPLFSFAGVFFLVFGILWNVLTVGGRFTNRDTSNMPRASRLLVYLGYVLLSVSIAHWFIVSHNIELQKLQSDLTQDGFRIFGLSLAYLVFAQGGMSLVESRNRV